MKVHGKNYPIYEMENKTCSKTPTRIVIPMNSPFTNKKKPSVFGTGGPHFAIRHHPRVARSRRGRTPWASSPGGTAGWISSWKNPVKWWDLTH